MKITALVENTTNNPSLGTQHGLSFYIEANGRRIPAVKRQAWGAYPSTDGIRLCPEWGTRDLQGIALRAQNDRRSIIRPVPSQTTRCKMIRYDDRFAVIIPHPARR